MCVCVCARTHARWRGWVVLAYTRKSGHALYRCFRQRSTASVSTAVMRRSSPVDVQQAGCAEGTPAAHDDGDDKRQARNGRVPGKRIYTRILRSTAARQLHWICGCAAPHAALKPSQCRQPRDYLESLVYSPSPQRLFCLSRRSMARYSITLERYDHWKTPLYYDEKDIIIYRGSYRLSIPE